MSYYKHLNEDGRIPARTECPFKAQCPFAQVGHCHHLGTNHQGEFSCASARAYDMVERMKDRKKL